MSERQLNQYVIVMNPKDENLNIKELERAVKSSVMWLKRNAVKEKNQWNYKIWIITSQIDGRKVKKSPILKKGRGPTRYYFDYKNCTYHSAEVPPHIHILIRCCPGETIVDELKNYWRKKYPKCSWWYKKTYDVRGAIDYMDNQILKKGYSDNLNIVEWDYTIQNKI